MTTISESNGIWFQRLSASSDSYRKAQEPPHCEYGEPKTLKTVFGPLGRRSRTSADWCWRNTTDGEALVTMSMHSDGD